MDISIYGFHDSSLCLKQDGEYFIYEFERFANERYAVLTSHWNSAAPDRELVKSFYSYIFRLHKISKVTNCYTNKFYHIDEEIIREVIPVENFVPMDHHFAHASSAYRQSPFDDCWVISYDGDGDNVDGSKSSFTVWRAKGDQISLVHDFQPYTSYSLGNCYLGLTGALSTIKKRKVQKDRYLYQGGNSGKLMGLASYGTPIESIKSAMRDFYDNGTLQQQAELERLYGKQLTTDALSGQEEYDFAATLQWAFEDKFFRVFDTLGVASGSRVVMSGGCALNILVNQRLQDMGFHVYVPPNSADCGLSFGMLAHHLGDRHVDLTYRGFEILDGDDPLPDGFSKTAVSNSDIAELLYAKKRIIGYIHGRAECGPRALGNRSILCYPTILHLKERLNAEVKFREWFRPFGAVTRLESVPKYFLNGSESRYMSFCPTLRPEYRFPSITHVDNTCRVQTVTSVQHPDLHDILSRIDGMGGEGILLNTSFNIKGKPILSKLADAFETLRDTKLDGFVYNGNLYERC